MKKCGNLKQENQRQTQKKWRDKQKKDKKQIFSVWIDEDDKKLIDTLKSQYGVKNNSELMSTILKEVSKTRKSPSTPKPSTPKKPKSKSKKSPPKSTPSIIDIEKNKEIYIRIKKMRDGECLFKKLEIF